MVDAIPQRIKLIRKQVLWPRDGEKRFSSKIKTLVFGKSLLKIMITPNGLLDWLLAR